MPDETPQAIADPVVDPGSDLGSRTCCERLEINGTSESAGTVNDESNRIESLVEIITRR